MRGRKNIAVIFIVLLTHFWAANAQKVELSDITELAGHFISEYFPDDEYRVSEVVPHYLDDEPVIYYMELDPEGWLLLSAERKAAPVLGFSYTGSLDYRSVFSGLEPAGEWVRDISETILEYSGNEGLEPHPDWKGDFEATKGVTIQPMITAKWGQGTGWNYYCPEDSEGPDGKAYVGCVAVAMAQALSVLEWPESGEGENTYQHYSYGEISANYSDSTYRWELMDNLNPNRHTALLLYHCATSVNMNFGPESSSANTSSAVDAFRDHFRISPNIRNTKRWEYGLAAWEEMMINELVAGRPIIYRGRSDEGDSGHAFNVDGVNNSEYFHINWGWGGSSNGYFLLHELNPTSTRSYNANQEAVIGIEPALATGFTDITAPGYILYPNPADNIIYFSHENDSRIKSCTVYSATGAIVMAIDSYNEQPIDISSLQPGLYFITISYSDGKTESSKFIKSHR